MDTRIRSHVKLKARGHDAGREAILCGQSLKSFIIITQQ